MKDHSVILIGMPGSGKSTIGVLLAKALGTSFCDTDLVLQNQENRLLQDILDKDGMPVFLKAEEEALLSVERRGVIATGGSAVLSQKGMEYLSQNGTIIYLKTPLEELKKRIRNITTRGIVKRPDQTLDSLFTEREPLYLRWADCVISTDQKTVEEIIEEIVEKIRA